MDDVDKESSVFLEYIARSEKEEDVYIKYLMEAVREAKKNRAWRHEYMMLLMHDQERPDTVRYVL